MSKTKRAHAAVGYVRMSTDKQEESPEQQRAEILKLAKKHGYHVIRWYEDHAISGAKTLKRKQFIQMISDAEQRGDFRAILCWDQDRFGRFDSIEAGEWISPLRRAGVELICVVQGRINWDDFAGRMIYQITQEGKHRYLVDLSRNSLRGMIHYAKNGNLLGMPTPYGYDRVYFDESGKEMCRIQRGDALAAGDLSLAAKILWLTLKMEWQKGINWLEAKWLDFKGFFVSVFQNAVYSLARFLTDAWAGIQVAWVETIAFLTDAWTIFISALKKGWYRFAGFFKKVWARVKSVFTDSDAEAEIQRINDEIAQQDQAIDQRQNEQILERDQERQRRRREIEQDRTGAQDQLDQMQAQEQAEREQRHRAALKSSEDKLAEARREWEAALKEAAEKRAAAEVAGEDDGPDRLEKFKQQLSDIGNVGGSLDQVENKSVGVQGAFNAAALRGLGAGGPADRTAKSVEAMDKKLGVLVREAQHGGLVFA